MVTTDFLCWEIYISIFMYQFLIISICYNILHEIFTGFKSISDKWLMFLITFIWLSLQKGHFFKNKSGRFIYHCLLHIALQDMTIIGIRCSWFRLYCVTKISFRMAMKAAKHLVTSIIWHICGQFVNKVYRLRCHSLIPACIPKQ